LARPASSNLRCWGRPLVGCPLRMVGVVGHCVNIVIVPTDSGIIQHWPAGG